MMPDRLMTITIVEVEGSAVLEWRGAGGAWGIYGDPHRDRAMAQRALDLLRDQVMADVTLCWEDGPNDELDVFVVRGAPGHTVFGGLSR